MPRRSVCGAMKPSWKPAVSAVQCMLRK